MLSAFVVSFFKYDLMTPMKYVGVQQYAYLLSDRRFWHALWVSAQFLLFVTPPAWLLGFFFASLVNDKIMGRGFFRGVYFFPKVLSVVAMATAWELLLRANGPVNALLGVRVSWLRQGQTAMLGIAMMSVWQNLGWYMVVFLTGLQAIPRELYDAAQVDGASGLRLLRHITLPLMRPVFAYAGVVSVIESTKVFTPMFLMTAGGPDRSTESLVMLIYQAGFKELAMGRASAMAVLMFVMVLLISLVQLRAFRVEEV